MPVLVNLRHLEPDNLRLSGEIPAAELDIDPRDEVIMVRQPLAKANNPLASCDYHGVANEERKLPGSEKLQTKAAFMAAIAKRVGR